MKTLSDDNEIFFFLEKAGKVSFDMTLPQFFDFEFENEICFLIFCPGKIFRGCFLFIIPVHELQRELREELIPTLINLPEKSELTELRSQALDRAEALLSGRKLDVGYFDAH